MDDFLRYCYSIIINDISDRFVLSKKPAIPTSSCSESLHGFIQTIKNANIKFNYNEEGRLHSKYLEDRYEPAIIIRYVDHTIYYYLFDGEIKDCIHPFTIIKYFNGPLYNVLYYSSERIEQGLPIKIRETFEEVTHHCCVDSTLIADSLFACGSIVNYKDYVKQDYTLHDCMTPQLFKFAD